MVANAAVSRQPLATMLLPSLIPFFPPKGGAKRGWMERRRSRGAMLHSWLSQNSGRIELSCADWNTYDSSVRWQIDVFAKLDSCACMCCSTVQGLGLGEDHSCCCCCVAQISHLVEFHHLVLKWSEKKNDQTKCIMDGYCSCHSPKFKETPKTTAQKKSSAVSISSTKSCVNVF